MQDVGFGQAAAVNLLIDGVVFAGGSGRRLGGVAKPLLRQPNVPSLLEKIHALLLPRVNKLWLSAPAEHAVCSVRLAWAGVVHDPGCGPLAALREVLKWTSADFLFLSAADLHAPHADLWNRLLSEHATVPDVDAWVVRDSERAQPLFALYRRDAVEKQLMTHPTLNSFQKLLAGMSVAWIQAETLGPAELASLEDIDTCEDAQRLGYVITNQRV